jgi:hypothetical protein
VGYLIVIIIIIIIIIIILVIIITNMKYLNIISKLWLIKIGLLTQLINQFKKYLILIIIIIFNTNLISIVKIVGK